MSENHKQKVILTFDVELWSEGIWLQPYITEKMIQNDTFPASMIKILDTLHEHNAHATFFVTLKVTEKYPEILKRIYEAGHEIGIHGPKHIRLEDYQPQEFKEDLIKQISIIKNLIGKKPIGYRAPHFSLNKKTYWVLEILKELNFSYDSSVFPKSMGEYGDSKSPKESYKIIKDLTEVPISVSSILGYKIPYAGGIYFRTLPFWIFTFFLNKELGNGLPVIYFHPHELDTNTPKICKGPFFHRILKYWGINKGFKKFEQLASKYNFDSIANTTFQI